MQRVMVTGGGGFVGSAVVRKLVADGIEVGIIGRRQYPDLAKLGVAIHSGDIRDRDFLIKACKSCDTVIHVAAKTGIWGPLSQYHDINVTGTQNVIDACKANNVSNLVYTSTPSVVFDSGDLCGVNEKTLYPKKFLCNYARTKVEAEKLVLAADSSVLNTTALRPHLVWGPGDTNLIPRLIQQGRSCQLKKIGDGRNLVDISYIDNVANAHILAAKNLVGYGSAKGKAYFISQGEPVNLWNWINKFFRRIDVPVVEKSISYRKAYWAGFLLEKIWQFRKDEREPPMTRFLAGQLAKSHWFSMDNAIKDLGYTPTVSNQEGMHRMVAWAKEENL